jgi:hypothetical protein
MWRAGEVWGERRLDNGNAKWVTERFSSSETMDL